MKLPSQEARGELLASERIKTKIKSIHASNLEKQLKRKKRYVSKFVSNTIIQRIKCQFAIGWFIKIRKELDGSV